MSSCSLSSLWTTSKILITRFCYLSTLGDRARELSPSMRISSAVCFRRRLCIVLARHDRHTCTGSLHTAVYIPASGQRRSNTSNNSTKSNSSDQHQRHAASNSPTRPISQVAGSVRRVAASAPHDKLVIVSLILRRGSPLRTRSGVHAACELMR